MTLVPLTVAVPCLGTVATTTPETAEPVINGARSIVVDVFIGTIILNASAVGGSVPTVIVTVPGTDVPPGPVAV